MDALRTNEIFDSATRSVDDNQHLTFALDGEMYAIGILKTKEILEYGGLTPVPMMPAHVRGVINLRGAVVPVIDLQKRFNRNTTNLNKRSCIVIVEINRNQEQQVLGIIVDAVSEVLMIPPENVSKAPNFGVNLRADFIIGMARSDEKFVIILDIDNVLSVDELAIISDMPSPTSSTENLTK